MFANYLIKNHILFDREIKPFKNYNYRTDFVLYSTNKKPIYVEIWGLLKENPKGVIEEQYKDTYNKKRYYMMNPILILFLFFIRTLILSIT